MRPTGVRTCCPPRSWRSDGPLVSSGIPPRGRAAHQPVSRVRRLRASTRTSAAPHRAPSPRLLTDRSFWLGEQIRAATRATGWSNRQRMCSRISWGTRACVFLPPPLHLPCTAALRTGKPSETTPRLIVWKRTSRFPSLFGREAVEGLVGPVVLGCGVVDGLSGAVEVPQPAGEGDGVAVGGVGVAAPSVPVLEPLGGLVVDPAVLPDRRGQVPLGDSGRVVEAEHPADVVEVPRSGLWPVDGDGHGDASREWDEVAG